MAGTMLSAADIIDRQGGSAAFAARLKVRAGTVRAWKHHNYFPRSAWPEIIKEFPELTVEKLLRIEARFGGKPRA